MSNRRYTQFYSTLHSKPVQLDCSFTVAAADSAGLGITGLAGPGIAAVYMHTSATPAAGNPNPASGYIYVLFQDNYKRYYFGDFQLQAPVTGAAINISDAAVMTAGLPYQIVTVGTSSTANWVAMGLPVGIAPAVGVSFIATATGSGTGTGTVKALGTTGIAGIEILGSPNLQLTSTATRVLGTGASGAYMILKCLDYANAVAAPAAGSVINLGFVLSNSMITQQGD